MGIKAIVLDLDRTLLRTDKSLSPYTVETLERCRAKGIKVVVATARPWRTAVRYCEMIKVDGIVVSNGARVIYGDRCTEYGICRQRAVALLDALAREPSLTVTLETGDTAYSNKPVLEYETILSRDLTGVAEGEGALKILVTYDSDKALETVKANLTDDLYYTVANGQLIQIMSKDATKWNGIKTVLELCGCRPEETAYFGDDNDDIEPIMRCGLGVAVTNAIDEVKVVADDIAGSNDEDGVAKYIEEHLMLRLEKVNGHNVWDILELKVSEEQRCFVADNSESIVEAYVAIAANGYAFPFGIYENETPVGFLMIGFGTDDDWEDAPPVAANNYNLWRLMIDQQYQGRGYGREAVGLALDFIRTFPCGLAEYCWLSYEPENHVARRLYRSFGFVETGDTDQGEIIAVLKL